MHLRKRHLLQNITICEDIYIGKTGRRLHEPFHKHLRDVHRNDKDTSKPVAPHFSSSYHSSQHITSAVSTYARATRKAVKNSSFKSALLISTESTSTVYSTNLSWPFTLPDVSINSVAHPLYILSAHKR